MSGLSRRKPGPPLRAFAHAHAPSEFARAYYAGYFDGEGCLQVHPRAKGEGWGVRIDFGQTVDVVVRELHGVYGGSLRVQPARGNVRAKTCWRLSQTLAVIRFLLDIYPYVREKRSQVEAVLEDYETSMHVTDAQALIARLRSMKRGG